MTIWTEVCKNSPPQMTALDLGLPLYLLRGIPIRFPFLNLSVLQFIPCSTIYCVWNWTRRHVWVEKQRTGPKPCCYTLLTIGIAASERTWLCQTQIMQHKPQQFDIIFWRSYSKSTFWWGEKTMFWGKGVTLFSCWANTEHLSNMHCAYPKSLRWKRFVLELRGWIPVPLE